MSLDAVILRTVLRMAECTKHKVVIPPPESCGADVQILYTLTEAHVFTLVIVFGITLGIIGLSMMVWNK